MISQKVETTKNQEGEINEMETITATATPTGNRVQIKASVPKLKKELTVTISFPKTLEEAMEIYPPEVILSNAFSTWTRTVQDMIRKLIIAGKSDEEVQSTIDTVQMGEVLSRESTKVDVKRAFSNSFKVATPEMQQEMLAMLQSIRDGIDE